MQISSKYSELEEPASEAGFDRDQVVTNCKESLNFFAGISVPDVFKYFFPPIFIAIWQLLIDAVGQKKGMLRLAIGLPRGFAKTFFLKIYCVWIILFSDRNFLLIVCNTEELAKNFLSDVFDILSSPNICKVFGDYRLGLERDTLTLKKFGFRGRDIIVAGVGAGTSLRGLNLKFRRPDIIIMDDMQNREEAENKQTANQMLIWLLGTLMKARNYERCLFIFVGNMYPFEGSILRRLKYNPQWISFICGAILADGESLWPEFRPIAEILEELDHDISMGHPEVFYAEVLNDEEAGTVSGLDLSKIPAYPEHLDSTEPQAGCVIIDPASGKVEGNKVAIGLFLIYDGTPVFRKVMADTYSPLECIYVALKLALEYKVKCVCIESNAYQYTLLFWFDFVCRKLKITGIECCELIAGGYTKNAKIRDMLNGLIDPKRPRPLLHPEVRNAVVYQISQWNPIKQKNDDDILDLAAWVDKAIELYGHMMELSGSIALEILDSFSVPAVTLPEEMEGVTF